MKLNEQLRKLREDAGYSLEQAEALIQTLIKPYNILNQRFMFT